MTTYSSLASVSATRRRLEELGLSTKKGLGQHFLIDDGVVGKTLRLAGVEHQQKVLEVGPGIGTLTEALLSTGAHLTAVELDADLLDGLALRFPALTLIGGDALAPATIKQLQELEPVSLVANLPYAVAATILLEYFQVLPSLKQATVMVQKEVADRIAAEPGTKDYGSYTIKLRLLASVVDSFKVSPQSFYPPPRVDSAVVKLQRNPLLMSLDERGDDHESSKTPEALAQPESLTALASMLADAAFFQRRKTIANSLKAYFKAQSKDGIAVQDLLAAAGIEPGVRGETLQVEAFIALAKEYHVFEGAPTS